MGRKSLEVSNLDTALSVEFAKERELHGWSEAELGRRAGIAQSVVHRILSGDYAIKISQASALAQAFGRSLKTFVARAESTLTSQSSSSPATPPPLSEEYITQLEQDLASGRYAYAAYTTPHNPADEIDSVGEESQIPDGWAD